VTAQIVLSESSGIALYEQIVEQVRTQILSGTLLAGEPLPSLRALARDLRVSLITTTRAYNELAAAGLIVNVPGKGSFVASVDPSQVRDTVLGEIAADLSRAVLAARRTGLANLTDLQELLIEKWQENESQSTN